MISPYRLVKAKNGEFAAQRCGKFNFAAVLFCGSRNRLQTKSPRSRTRSHGEERYPLLSWLLEVMNDPLCDRGESRRSAAWPGGRWRRSPSDTVCTRAYECITNVLYTLRGSYFASPDPMKNSSADRRCSGKSVAIAGRAIPVFPLIRETTRIVIATEATRFVN